MVEKTKDAADRSEILRMAVQIVAAYVGKNPVAADEVPEVINTVYNSLCGLDHFAAEHGAEPPKPAVSIRQSIDREAAGPQPGADHGALCASGARFGARGRAAGVGEHRGRPVPGLPRTRPGRFRGAGIARRRQAARAVAEDPAGNSPVIPGPSLGGGPRPSIL